MQEAHLKHYQLRHFVISSLIMDLILIQEDFELGTGVVVKMEPLTEALLLLKLVQMSMKLWSSVADADY